MSFIFAGTPEFAARVLRELHASGRGPVLVVSQPDRPQGRGRRTSCPPTVVEARRLGLEAVQTEDLSSPHTVELMAGTGADTLVIAAFGQILRALVLDTFFCLNVHASLLPAYRGAAPIARALMAGEERTGVTIMRVTQGLDEGPWALRTDLSLSLLDDAGSVSRALAVLGASGIDQVLTGLQDGTITWQEQRGEAGYAHKLTAADLVLNLSGNARSAHDQVRALSPGLGARTCGGSLDLKVWRTWPYGAPGLDSVPSVASEAAGRPGILVVSGCRLFAGCGEGVIELLSVQPAGKGRMATAEFLRGYSCRLSDDLLMPNAPQPRAADVEEA